MYYACMFWFFCLFARLFFVVVVVCLFSVSPLISRVLFIGYYLGKFPSLIIDFQKLLSNILFPKLPQNLTSKNFDRDGFVGNSIYYVILVTWVRVPETHVKTMYMFVSPTLLRQMERRKKRNLRSLWASWTGRSSYNKETLTQKQGRRWGQKCMLSSNLHICTNACIYVYITYVMHTQETTHPIHISQHIGHIIHTHSSCTYIHADIYTYHTHKHIQAKYKTKKKKPD